MKMLKEFLLLLLLMGSLLFIGTCTIRKISRHEKKQEEIENDSGGKHTYKDFTKPTQERNF